MTLQNLATTFAKCGSNSNELLKALKGAFLKRVNEFDAQGLSAFSWAFQKLQPGQNIDLMLASSEALCAMGAGKAPASSLTQSLLAMATLLVAPNAKPSRLYSKFRPAVRQLLDECGRALASFDVLQIATTTSSLAKMVGCVGLFQGYEEGWHAQRMRFAKGLKAGLLKGLAQFQAQDLAIVLWGLGRIYGSGACF